MIMRRYYLFGVILLALVVRIPGWFTIDLKERWHVFAHDEWQHIEIAALQIQHWDSTELPDMDISSKIYNVRGFGIHLGTIAYGVHSIFKVDLDEENLVLIGRIISTFYAILLILLTYKISLEFWHRKDIAILAATCLAIFDLNVTYSHYALPSISYIFWCYFTIFMVSRLYERWNVSFESGKGFLQNWKAYFFISFGMSMVFATKFDVIPLLVLLGTLFIIVRNKKATVWHGLLTGGVLILISIPLFYLVTLNQFSFQDVQYSFNYLMKENNNVIPKDNHYLYNPVLLLFGLMSGTSIWIILLATAEVRKLIKKTSSKKLHPGFAIFFVFLLLEFLLRWKMDTMFIRRLNIFLPMLAILSAKGLIDFFKNVKILTPGLRQVLIVVVLTYTLGITLVSQLDFWEDTRLQARHYLQENYPESEIFMGPYVRTKSFRPTAENLDQADIFIIHESFYGRFWKYFITPFKIPKCCEEVYHCWDKEECLFYQSLLQQSNPDYNQIKIIQTRRLFPERYLFKRLFGTFETFLGDVRIYERRRLRRN